MDAATRQRLDTRARIIKALAHPTRLFIIEELSRGDRTVTELTDMIGSDMSTVSRHLSVLRNAGIVRDERDGAQIYYHLLTPCVLQIFSCVEGVLDGPDGRIEPKRRPRGRR